MYLMFRAHSNFQLRQAEVNSFRLKLTFSSWVNFGRFVTITHNILNIVNQCLNKASDIGQMSKVLFGIYILMFISMTEVFV